MADAWQFQLRINVSADLSARLREAGEATCHDPLHDVLRKHKASLKCQFDAFAGYASEAERLGTEKYPLYQWTRDTLENPVKKARYLRVFTVYVDGAEVYGSAVADLLQAELSALAGHAGIESVVRFDTNPATNPQAPAREL